MGRAANKAARRSALLQADAQSRRPNSTPAVLSARGQPSQPPFGRGAKPVETRGGTSSSKVRSSSSTAAPGEEAPSASAPKSKADEFLQQKSFKELAHELNMKRASKGEVGGSEGPRMQRMSTSGANGELAARLQRQLDKESTLGADGVDAFAGASGPSRAETAPAFELGGAVDAELAAKLKRRQERASGTEGCDAAGEAKGPAAAGAELGSKVEAAQLGGAVDAELAAKLKRRQENIEAAAA